MRRLTPSQAFRLGFIYGLKKCSADMRAMAEKFDAEIARLDDKRHADLRAMKERFDNDITSLQSEFAAVEAVATELVRDKINRTAAEAVAQAADERAQIPDQWLN